MDYRAIIKTLLVNLYIDSYRAPKSVGWTTYLNP